jgi:hypothetical protein
MEELKNLVQESQTQFTQRLRQVFQTGGLTQDRYVRYLSMQYHLTKGVQRHFFMAASHPDLEHRGSLRDFLVQFAKEEEAHFEIAKRDIENMGRELLPCPFEVELWWAYFNQIIFERPFVRLGATCILENIAGSSRQEVTNLLSQSSFITPRNSRFVTIHMHGENLPHGDQILEALSNARLEASHLSDLVEGAIKGSKLFLMMLDQAFGLGNLQESHPRNNHAA